MGFEMRAQETVEETGEVVGVAVIFLVGADAYRDPFSYLDLMATYPTVVHLLPSLIYLLPLSGSSWDFSIVTQRTGHSWVGL